MPIHKDPNPEPSQGPLPWDGHLDAEVTRALEVGVASWVEQGKLPITPAERLRRIRAAQAGQAPNLQVWVAPQASGAIPRPRTWRSWTLAASFLIAALVGIAFASWRSIHPGAGLSKAQEDPPDIQKKKTLAGLLPVAGIAQQGAQGLFIRALDDAPRAWQVLGPGEPCTANTLVQAALGKGGGELMLFDRHRVRLAPGTLVRLGDDPLRPWIDLWRGKLEVWAAGAPFRIGTLSAGAAKNKGGALEGPEKSGGGGELQAGGYGRTDVLTLEAGGYASIETAAFQPRMFDLDGFLLMDESSLEPLACHVTRRAAEPAPVRIQEGTANLLRVVPCNFEGQSVEAVAALLGEALEVRVRLSAQARKLAGQKTIALAMGEVSGAEGLAALATQAGLVVQIRDGDVVLEVPGEKPELPAPPDEEF